jgi:glycogen(starch) synthase
MRILVIIERYPPLHQGGDETACQTFVNGLRGRGHDIRVLTSEYGLEKPRVDRAEGVHRVLHRPWYTASLLDQAWHEVSDHRNLRRLLVDFRPEMIFSWNQTSLFGSLHRVLKETGLPIVYFMGNIWIHWHIDYENQRHALWARPGTSVRNRIFKPLIRAAVRAIEPGCRPDFHPSDLNLQHVVQCSEASLQRHHDRGFRGDEWVVIYNGVDTKRFHPGPPLPEDAPLHVLFAGRLVVEKGPHTLVEAAARLRASTERELRFTVVGERAYPVAYSDGLRARAAALGLTERMVFEDAVRYEEMPALLRRHQVLVFPSNIPEGFPMMLVEAMASGLAVIGTTTGGSAEILHEGITALTFPPDDADALARCLERIRDDDGLRRRLSNGGREWVRTHCELDLVLGQLEDYLRRITTSRGA